MLEELKTFIAVVEYENFTKAGDSINLSQPSVSLHIKHLEEYFNTTLIQRSVKQKNIIITKSGRLLYERAKQIENILENTKNEILDYATSIKGELNIGASFTIGEYVLPSFLGEFSKKYPNLKYNVNIENTTNICKKVEDFKLDLGLVEGIVTSNKFIHQDFYNDKLVLAVPYKDELCNKKFEIQDYQNKTWIAREKGSGSREYLDIFLNSNNIIPKNLIVFGSNYAVKEGVKNNLGITLMSYYIAKKAAENKEIVIIKTNENYSRSFSYILPKTNIVSKSIETFINSLKEYLNIYN